MTLREALDLLELNERTLEQSMLESSLQNRLEHTELRHVLRVFEAYRKVNAFLNPSFNTQGDARMTIIDESVPGGPMLEVTRSAIPVAAASAAVTAGERDTFSDTMIETSTIAEATRIKPKSTLALGAAESRADGVNLFVMLGLIAAAFSVGMVVLGPTMSLLLKPAAPSAVRPSPAPSISSPAPIIAAPPVVIAPPAAPVVKPSAPVAQPTPPVVATVKPVAPVAPIKPVTPAITKPVVRPAAPTKPPVVAQVKPRVTPTPRVSTPRVTAQPRVAAPRVRVQPRVAALLTPRASSRPQSVAVPSRRTVNQRQFSNWDGAGVVLRYRSWSLVPDAVRGLSTNAFRVAVFVARDPASLPDIPR